MKNFEKIVVSVMCMLFAASMCITLATAASPVYKAGGEILAELHEMNGASAEKEAKERQEIDSALNSIYNEIENSMKKQSMYSTVFEDDQYVSYYAGAYIEGDKLIVCVTTEAAIPAETDSSIVYRVVDNSYNELINAKERAVTAYKEYFQLYKGSGTDEEDLLLSLSSFAIDEELNKVVVGVVNLDNSKVATFYNLFEGSDIFTFEDANGYFKEYATYKPGVALFICTERNGTAVKMGRLSMGYRAKRVVNGETTLYGFVTAGHGSMDSIDKIVYSDINLSNKIGTIYQCMVKDSVDVAFVTLASGVTIGTTTQYSDYIGNKSGGDAIVEDYYMQSVAKGSTVYKVGAATFKTSGTVKNTNYDATIGGVAHTNLTYADIEATAGDSGGLVYMYFNNGYKPAGIITGGKKQLFGFLTLYTKASEVAINTFVFPY